MGVASRGVGRKDFRHGVRRPRERLRRPADECEASAFPKLGQCHLCIAFGKLREIVVLRNELLSVSTVGDVPSEWFGRICHNHRAVGRVGIVDGESPHVVRGKSQHVQGMAEYCVQFDAVSERNRLTINAVELRHGIAFAVNKAVVKQNAVLGITIAEDL